MTKRNIIVIVAFFAISCAFLLYRQIFYVRQGEHYVKKSKVVITAPGTALTDTTASAPAVAVTRDSATEMYLYLARLHDSLSPAGRYIYPKLPAGERLPVFGFLNFLTAAESRPDLLAGTMDDVQLSPHINGPDIIAPGEAALFESSVDAVSYDWQLSAAGTPVAVQQKAKLAAYRFVKAGKFRLMLVTHRPEHRLTKDIIVTEAGVR